MTFKDAFEDATNYLQEKDIFEARLNAWYLIEFITGLSRADYLLQENQEMNTLLYQRYKELTIKRAEHIPLQYLTGIQEFMGLRFIVNESVLIPRQDTEILVEEVLKLCKNRTVLDVCTGSGCIIVSLAVQGHTKEAAASDISLQALEVAKKNARNHQVQVEFIQSDMFENINITYDIIVSNPPYIETEEIKGLMPEVKEHEPYLALDGDKDGLKFYRLLAKEGWQRLNDNGYLCMEIGYNQGEKVKELLEQQNFCNVQIIKDYARLDRVIIAMKS